MSLTVELWTIVGGGARGHFEKACLMTWTRQNMLQTHFENTLPNRVLKLLWQPLQMKIVRV